MEGSNLFTYVIFSILIMLVFALSLIWFFVYSSKKLALAKIKEQNLLIDFKQKLLSNTLETQEKEKRKIAMELHDDVSSILNLTLLNVRQQNLSSPSSQLKDLENMIYNCSEKVRNISHELTPLQMKQFNIKESIDELIFNLKKFNTLKINVYNFDVINLSNDINKLHLFRIIQELINNALKHSKATEVIIRFSKDPNNLVMTYDDNGIGLSEKAMHNGIGMTNMQSRVAVLNGSFEIINNDKPGLTIIFKFND